MISGVAQTACPLQGVFKSVDSGDEAVLKFRSDPQKKAAFWLEDPPLSVLPDDHGPAVSLGHHVSVAPAHFRIQTTNPDHSTSATLFYMGGFQLVSNAKSVEVYLQSSSLTEADYLTTSRGILYKEGGQAVPDAFKTMCVIPGGPRPVRQVLLKLLSLKPDDTSSCIIRSLKVTARIPEESSNSKDETRAQTNNPSLNADQASISSSPLFSMPSASIPGMPGFLGGPFMAGGPSVPSLAAAHSAPPASVSVGADSCSSPAMTQSDLGAAMAGMSFTMRSTEDRLTKAIQQSAQSTAMALQADGPLFHLLNAHHGVHMQTLSDQSALLARQQELLLQQNQILQRLRTEQETTAREVVELRRLVTTLVQNNTTTTTATKNNNNSDHTSSPSDISANENELNHGQTNDVLPQSAPTPPNLILPLQIESGAEEEQNLDSGDTEEQE